MDGRTRGKNTWQFHVADADSRVGKKEEEAEEEEEEEEEDGGELLSMNE